MNTTNFQFYEEPFIADIQRINIIETNIYINLRDNIYFLIIFNDLTIWNIYFLNPLTLNNKITKLVIFFHLKTFILI
jgi:hypothetical protein